MDTQGLRWSLAQGQIVAADTFPSDQGEQLYYMKVQGWGVMETIMLTADEYTMVQDHIGEMVRLGGRLEIEHKKSGETRFKMHLDELEPV